MHYSRTDSTSPVSNIPLLLTYVADLELEVDRLRRHGRFIRQEVLETLKRVHVQCAEAPRSEDSSRALVAIDELMAQLAAVLRDLQEPSGYHPAHDQVIAIALRPLLEQVFRSQQRLMDTPKIMLRLELESDYVEWFPARLRHIVENLFSNALKYHDPAKAESWVRLGMRVSPDAYEIRVADNGIGMPDDECQQLFHLLYRAAPTREARPGVGLAVVKLLVEQSGGTLTVDSGEGDGTTFVVVVPRYDVDDYLNSRTFNAKPTGDKDGAGKHTLQSSRERQE